MRIDFPSFIRHAFDFHHLQAQLSNFHLHIHSAILSDALAMGIQLGEQALEVGASNLVGQAVSRLSPVAHYANRFGITEENAQSVISAAASQATAAIDAGLQHAAAQASAAIAPSTPAGS